MPLTLVSLPIGNPDDITLRAISTLQSCDLVIGEDRKPLVRLLARLELREKPYRLLNEHSNSSEVDELAQLCLSKDVALVSDAGSPGFCDPGAKLIDALLHSDSATKISALPGPSALTTLLSLAPFPMSEFYFLGFPPREKHQRAQFFRKLTSIRSPIVLMDTPYRLQKMVEELMQIVPQRHCILACDLSKTSEQVFWCQVRELKLRTQNLTVAKPEFMILLGPV